MGYRSRRLPVLLVLLIALLVPAFSPYTAGAADCSAVYASLPSWINTAIDRNLSDYKKVSNETGVPWEMLAGIHYRETNFSRSNPSNGYGIFQFTPPPKTYTPGPVSDSEFLEQLRYMANKVQTDYVFRSGKATRKLTANEKDVSLIKDTLFSYNGRATVYANQASAYGFSSSATPYEGSPYVMNKFDCARAGMGIITQDYGSIDGTDTRYGAFTMYARLKGDSFWKSLISDKTASFRFERLYGTSPAALTTNTQASYANYTKTISINGRLYVFHYDANTKSLRYTVWNGTSWSSHILDGSGSTVAGATNNDVGTGMDVMEYNGGLQVYYYDATDKSLRHAWTTPNLDDWRTETMDGTATSLSGAADLNVGRYPQVLKFGSDIQLFYYNATDSSLRHAWWGKDGVWKFEELDGTDGSIIGRNSDIGSAVSANYYSGKLQLFYYDKINGLLLHTWWSNSRWKTEIFDGEAGSGSVIGNVINSGQQVKTITFNGSLYVYYYDNATNFSGGRTSGWRLAYWYNGNWNGFMLDGGNSSLSGSSLKTAGDISLSIHDGRQMQAFYQDSTGGLRHAWFSK